MIKVNHNVWIRLSSVYNYDDETTLEQIEKDIKEQVINEVIPHEL